ncbi:hypothetical protein Acr_27g0000690 [Actinidia rufa]|uniref:Secreted protein n=1 Tax=Actinidia rufa TaxID=165716 RepID=A0A7J0H5G3_9ERIC|nr:hypothetical protein Acr_27g0000690 [Actinidia rufa]
MVVGGKLLALLLPFSLLLSLAYSATTTVTGTAATCFATLGSAAVGSTTFAVRGSGTRRYAAGGGSTARSTASSTESPESTVSTVCYDAVVDFLLSGLGVLRVQSVPNCRGIHPIQAQDSLQLSRSVAWCESSWIFIFEHELVLFVPVFKNPFKGLGPCEVMLMIPLLQTPRSNRPAIGDSLSCKVGAPLLALADRKERANCPYPGYRLSPQPKYRGISRYGTQHWRPRVRLSRSSLTLFLPPTAARTHLKESPLNVDNCRKIVS